MESTIDLRVAMEGKRVNVYKPSTTVPHAIENAQ